MQEITYSVLPFAVEAHAKNDQHEKWFPKEMNIPSSPGMCESKLV